MTVCALEPLQLVLDNFFTAHDLWFMTLLAIHLAVRSVKWEPGSLMIKPAWLPAFGLVTPQAIGYAVHFKLAVMLIRMA